ncbi:MAG: type I restriction enzyme HsdR N-terminal domain-containing protein [Armatimonadetes bacterium]|nr:type I restriction enzyme HsdR N-terminal domain-containing protein [Armatimonadota bacterium]
MAEAPAGGPPPELCDKLREVRNLAGRLHEPSEDETLARIIDRVLAVVGWPEERRKIRYRTQGGGYADMALLSESRQPLVFVEAKELGAPLRDGDVRQALSYAQAQGAKWAVLSNGYEWHIYDAVRQAEDPDRLIAKTDLRQLDQTPEEVCRTLWLLSPESITGGLLDAEAQAGRAYQALLAFLKDEKKVARTLEARKHGFRGGLRLALKFALDHLPKQLAGAAPSEHAGALARSSALDRLPQARRGYRIQFPHGSVKTVQHATEVLVEVAGYLVAAGKLTRQSCPVSVTTGQRYLVHTEPVHPHGRRFFLPKELSNGLFIETHYSASNAVEYSYRLWEHFGLSRDVLKIENLEA